MRTRVIDNAVTTYIRESGVNAKPTSAPINATHAQSISGSRQSIEDVSHSNYAQRKKRGEIILGDCTITSWSRDVTSASFRMGPFTNGFNNLYTGDFAYSIVLANPVTLNFNGVDIGQIALAKALAKAKEPGVMGGELLRDFTQTVRMLKRPFSGAQDLLKRMTAYRNKRLGKTAASAAKATSNTWLEFRYGWQPLIMDGQATINAAHERRSRALGKRLVFRSSESVTQKGGTTFNLKPLVGTFTWPCTGSVQCEEKRTASAGVIAQFDPERVSDEVSRFAGMRASDIPSTIWELTPYSFVVDWFTNAGTWLRAVTPVPGVSILGNWVSTVTDFSRICSGTIYLYHAGPPAGTLVGSAGGATERSKTLRRICNVPLSSTPVLLRKPLSATHAVDALALSTDSILSVLRSFRR